MTQDLVSRAAGVKHASDLMADDDQLKMLFDRLLAMASQKVVPASAQVFSQVIPIIQQGMQRMQKYQPPPPTDPGTVALQTGMAENQRKSAADQATQALGQQRLQLDQQNAGARNQNDQIRNSALLERNQVQRDNADLASQTRITTTEMDNQTAEDINDSRVAAGIGSGLRNGESMRGVA